jgi:hypothetical protein
VKFNYLGQQKELWAYGPYYKMISLPAGQRDNDPGFKPLTMYFGCLHYAQASSWPSKHSDIYNATLSDPNSTDVATGDDSTIGMLPYYVPQQAF